MADELWSEPSDGTDPEGGVLAWPDEDLPALYPIVALVRDGDAAYRALFASRELVRLVAELDPGSAVVLELASGPTPGAVRAHLEVHGPAAHDLGIDELRAVLGDAVVIRRDDSRIVRPPVVVDAVELRRMPMAGVFEETEDDAAPPGGSLEERLGGGYAAPLPSTSDSSERLLAALALSRDVRVRTVLAPADDFDRRMVLDELGAMHHGSGVAAYTGSVVRTRTVVVADRRVPALVRAALRQRAAELIVEPRAPGSVRDLWIAPARSVIGSAVAEMHAVALTRVPAAGEQQRLGIATRRPEIRVRPLDPEPPVPRDPIRLGAALNAEGRRIDVVCDIDDHRRHMFFEGQSGSGKTTCLLQIAWSLMSAGHAVTVLDPHGELASAVAAYARVIPGARARYIRHGDREHPTGLNVLADPDEEVREQSIGALLEYLQETIDPKRTGQVGERLKRTVTLVAQGCREAFGVRASLATIVSVLLSRDTVTALAARIRRTAPELARRLDAELGALRDNEYTELISWAVSRLQPLLRTPALRAILGSGHDAVDLVDAIDSGTSTIVDLASPELGPDVAGVLGAMWMLKIRAAMGRRRDRSTTHVVLIDEAHLHSSSTLAALLAEARKFGIALIVATQSADNLSPQTAAAVEANCATHVSLRTGIRSAPAASARLAGWPASELVRLDDLTAAVSLSRGGVSTTPFTMFVDHRARMAENGVADGDVAMLAAEAAAATREQLRAPQSATRPMTDADVARALEDPRERRARSERIARRADARTSARIDSWLGGAAEPAGSVGASGS